MRRNRWLFPQFLEVCNFLSSNTPVWQKTISRVPHFKFKSSQQASTIPPKFLDKSPIYKHSMPIVALSVTTSTSYSCCGLGTSSSNTKVTSGPELSEPACALRTIGQWMTWHSLIDLQWQIASRTTIHLVVSWIYYQSKWPHRGPPSRNQWEP